MFRRAKLITGCLLFFLLGGCARDTGADTVILGKGGAKEHEDVFREEEAFSEEQYFGPGVRLVSEEKDPEMYASMRELMKVRQELDFIVETSGRSSDDTVKIDGEYYCLVEYGGVRSWADFEACLTEIYDKEYLDKTFLPYCTEGTESRGPLFVDYNDGLYRLLASTPVIGPDLDGMRIYRTEEGKLALVCKQADAPGTGERAYYIWYFRENSDKRYGYELVRSEYHEG